MIDIEKREYWELVPETREKDDFFKYFAEISLTTDQRVSHTFRIDFITKPQKLAKMISDLIRGRYGNEIDKVEVLSLVAEPFPLPTIGDVVK